jgi:glucokinase
MTPFASLGPAPGPALAIDVGGTKLAAGIVDGAGHRRAHAQVPTDPDPDLGSGSRSGSPDRAPGAGAAEELFHRLTALVDEVRSAWISSGGAAPVVCGVGSGGPMDADGDAVSPLNIPAWDGFPLRSRLAAHTGLPTFVDNDAKALALAEGWVGAAAGRANYLGMVVSTGVGGGIVLDGRLLDGERGNAGHIGHVVVEPDGRSCRCGSRGCLEAEASGTAIAAITGRAPAEAGADMIERTGTMVGRAVAMVAVLLDLRLAVVAGSVALGYGEPFFAAAQAEVDARARLAYAAGCVVRPAGLAAEAPLVGAAAVGYKGLGFVLPPGA